MRWGRELNDHLGYEPQEHGGLVDGNARNGTQVANRSSYIAMAVTVEGNRDILGLWAGTAARARSTGSRC